MSCRPAIPGSDRWTRIDNPDDPRIEVFQGLRDHTLRQLRELPGADMEGVFISEGDIVVERALNAGYELQSVLIDGKRNKAIPAPIETTSVPVYACGPEVLQRITGYHLHRGLIACFKRRPLLDPTTVMAGATTLLVLEAIANPTNMGVMLRCGAGLGVDAFVMDPTCSDPLYRRSGRVSMGEAYALPYARLDPFPDGLAAVHEAGFHTLALTPAVDAVGIDTLRFQAKEKIAIVLGSEGPGLTEGTLNACHERVQIPMSGTVDSLNVGSASAVAFYAIQQARRARGA